MNKLIYEKSENQEFNNIEARKSNSKKGIKKTIKIQKKEKIQEFVMHRESHYKMSTEKRKPNKDLIGSSFK